MIQLDVIQGESIWHEARAKYRRTASLAPAIMGSSKNKSRTEAIAYMATGMEKEFSQWVQDNLLDRGHLIESFAKPLAEKIIGKKLYPITAISDDEYLLASYDGLTADDEDAWECKSWNEKKAEDVRAGNIPDEDVWQVVQQLAIGATRCLYMVTDGTEEKTVYCWMARTETYRLIEQLIAGWNQADKDAANYQHVEHAEKPKAEAIMDLPAISVQATGMVTHSNLPEFKAAAETYIANINTDLQTDQQFADAEATVKFCKATEEKLEVTKAAILAQTATIDEVIRTVNYIQEQLSKKRIMLNNLVSKEKDARKLAIVSKAGNDFTAYVQELEAETRPIQLNVQRPDFALAIKGMKKLSAMQDAVDTALAHGKIAADAAAKDIRAKLVIYSGTAACGYEFLFRDLQTLIAKPKEDFELVISSRVQAYIDGENAKREAERVRIQAEEEAKARAKVEAEAAFEARQKALKEAADRADEQRKVEAEQLAAQQAAEAETAKRELAQKSEQVPVSSKPDNVVVIEHQAEISAFLASRDFGKEAGKVRAILVEFVKYQETWKHKAAA